MEDVDEVEVDRDLFGEPVTESKPRRKAVAPSAGWIRAPAVDVPAAAAPVIALRLPERYAVRGKVHDNELRQLASKDGPVGGTLTEIPTRTGSSYSFQPALGARIRIVPRRTSVAFGDDPILLLEGAGTPAEIQDALEHGKGVWLAPKPRPPADIAPGELAALCEAVIASWRERFVFREAMPALADAPAVPGLRRPQVGALHAALAHATSSTDPATIVMPTGTGKTETMLAIHAHERIARLMVVVPTDALREQIARKFESMGILQDQECLPHDILYPVVLRLNHIPKTLDEVDALFGRANVIVTTIAIAGRAAPEVQERMAQNAGALFIDEAHHIKAPSWREFRAWFVRSAGAKPIYQFTATPFREDGGKVDGKFIYYYPLRKAQEEGYFGKVEFRAVSELTGAEADAEIARLVGETLHRDSAMNLNHLAMARCKTIKRAKEVHAIYARELPDCRPVLVHSDMSTGERRDNLARLRSFESRLIVCVDMLGEGFDLPELKIAALHDVFKSVAVTLQFVGRFTRSRSDLGTATLIANTDQDRLDRALSKLYAEEADWNFLIANLSADRVGRAMDRAALFDGFQGDLHEVPLQTIEPSMNAVVFKTPGCERWNPHGIEDAVPTGSFVGMKVNERQRLAVCVLRQESQSKWTRSSTATDVTWELILAHWDETAQLLYLSSTGGSVTDALARTIGGDGATRIRGQQVFRCFHEFRQLVIRNLGMTHRQGGGTRYSMVMGIDVSGGLDSLKANERIQNNIFGAGFEQGEPRTLGCSIKGKFWSHARVDDLVDWIAWCGRLGLLLANDAIPSSAAFTSAMRPRQISARPDAVPLVIHWPQGMLHAYEERVELRFGDRVYGLTECELALADNERTGPLRFGVKGGDDAAMFEVVFDGGEVIYRQVGGPAVTVKTQRKTSPAADYFADDAPQIDFADGSFLIYSHLYVLPEELELRPHLDGRLVIWDWTGTNIRAESQGIEQRTDSVQYRVIEELKTKDFDIVFDDDGTGEFADVIAIKIRDGVVEVTLYHCKYSSKDDPGSRLKDVYEVAGQALKSVQFCHKPKRFLRNMIAREKRRLEEGTVSRFAVGTLARLRQLYAQWDLHRFEYKVVIVQPGLSKQKISDEILLVLAFVEKSLIEHRSIPLEIIVSH